MSKHPSERPSKRRIAILGGGIGGLSAAFALSSRPGWQDELELTVYTQGWRLGGKGASSRNPDQHDRIEEHGLHVWAGFYVNSFRLIQDVYDELGRPPGARMARWQDAFLRRDLVAVLDWMEPQPGLWFVGMPPNDALPGQVGALPTPSMMAQAFRGWVRELWDQLHDSRGPDPDRPPLRPAPSAAALAALWTRLLPVMTRGHLARARQRSQPPPADLLDQSWPELYRQVATSPGHHRLLLDLAALKGLDTRQDPETLLADRGLRHLFILLDLALAVMRGTAADRLWLRGFRAADDEEWLAWLWRHGACAMSLRAPVLACVYEYVFGFAEGDPTRPALAAGTATHGILRLGFGYAGSIFWPMRAGMGETIFSPLYQVLARRGVRFRFFHRVEGLQPSADGRRVGRIQLARQARVRGDYQPLIDVDGLPCWPHEPLWEQLQDGDALRTSGAVLESASSTWAGQEAVELQQGRDFDDVVLAIPVAVLRRIAEPLARVRAPWRTMLDGVPTAATVAMQLWLEPDAQGLGWTHGPGMASSMAWPYGSWADLSHTLAEEGWQGAGAPGSAAYFCGALGEPEEHAPAAQRQASLLGWARDQARSWLEGEAHHLWPATGQPFDWQLLADPLDRVGVERLEAQYFRVNVEPSERYSMSTPGSTQLRLAPDEAGFDNLVLAGDWTWTAVNAGCIEATVMSGFQAARGLTGAPLGVAGESWVSRRGLRLRARNYLRRPGR